MSGFFILYRKKNRILDVQTIKTKNMKKLYTTITLCLSMYIGHAQYTLTSASSPSIGDIETTWELNPATIPAATASGINQIWNYTGVSIPSTVTAVSSTYVAKSSAPNSSLFPAATIAQTDNGTDFTMSSGSTGLTIYGTTNATETIVYQNPLTYVTFPFTYGNITTDTYSTSYTTNSIPVSQMGTVTTTGDGTGTLNTPGNSFPNVLRVKLQLKSILNYGSFGTFTSTTTQYLFLSSVSKFALLSVGSGTQTSNTGTTTTTSNSTSGTINNMVLAGIKESKKDANFSIYPNPVVNNEVELYFVLSQEENYNASIYNTLGQKVKEIAIGNKSPGVYNEKIDLSTLKSGVYYIHLKGNKQEGVQKIVVQ